jgi:hypothetical protein
VSTTTLHAAVDAAPTTSHALVGNVLASLRTPASVNLTAAETALARLAAVEHPDADDKARAVEILAAGERAHHLLQVTGASLRALADLDNTGQLDPDLVHAVGAAEPMITATVVTCLQRARTPNSAPLFDALLAEIRLAQDAAAAMGAAPDTVPEEWC